MRLLQLAKQHGITFMETSAWTNVNIASAFTTLTKEILEAVSDLLLHSPTYTPDGLCSYIPLFV